MKTKLSIASLVALTLMMTSQAQASTVQFTLTGGITSAEVLNPFNLSVDSTITASGFFDDTTLENSITAGITKIDFSVASNNMEIRVGNTTFTDTDDLFGGGVMFFNNGIIDGLTFENSAFDSADTFGVYISDFGGTGITGNWDVNSYTAVTTVVPVPAALWLFGTGLLSLGAISRRKHNI